MACGAGDSGVAEAAIEKAKTDASRGDTHAREEVYGSFQRAGNEKKADDSFAAAFDHLNKANGQLAKDGKLTEQSRSEYVAAIEAADALDRQAVADGIQSLAKALDKAYPPAARETVNRLELERDYLLLTTAPEIQLALAALQKELERAKTTDDQVKIVEAMRALVPDVVKKEREIVALTAEPQALMQQIQVLQFLERSPVLTRFAYAQALDGSGERENAAALMEQVLQIDPRVLDDPVFKKFAAGLGIPAGTDVPDNPYLHIQAADDAAQIGNHKTAEGAMLKAIAAADKLPMHDYRKQLEQTENTLKTDTAEDRKKQLIDTKRALEEIVALPGTTRVAAATFYLRQAKPDQAKQMLAEAALKDPRIKDDATYKQLIETSDATSASVISSALDSLKKSGKDMISDLGAGTAGLIATTIMPGGRLVKLGAGLLAGGLTKHGLNMAMGMDSTLGKDMLWGGVDALAFVTGAGVRKGLVGQMEKGLGKESLEVLFKDGAAIGFKNLETREAALLSRKSMLETALAGTVKDPSYAGAGSRVFRVDANTVFERVLTDAEKTTIKQTVAGSLSRAERSALDSVLAQRATDAEKKLLADKLVVIGEQHNGLLAERSALQEQIAKFSGANGPTGLNGLRAATELLTKGVAGRKEMAAAELREAVAQAPWWQKPILWSQGQAPLLWKVPNKALSGFQYAKGLYLESRGSTAQVFNPLNAFSSVESYGSLNRLKAQTFWKLYAVDGASVGATSLIFRGAHEADKIGTYDAVTGKKYTPYDAVVSTLKNSAIDAATGGLVMAGTRGAGGIFTRYSGAAGEINLTPRSGLATNPAAELAQPVRQYVYRPIGNVLSTPLSFNEGTMTARMTAATLTGVGLLSPKLGELPELYEKKRQYEDIIKQLEKPIVDAHPERSATDSR